MKSQKNLYKGDGSRFLNDACYDETSQCDVSPDAIMAVVGALVEMVEQVKVC